MKPGLETIPSNHDLQKVYERLLHGYPVAITEAHLALDAQWARFDPRLAEILVRYLFENWQNLDPMKLRDALLGQPWPSAMGPLLEFVERLVPRVQMNVFRAWKNLVCMDFEVANWAQFFIGHRKIAGKLMFNDARFSTEEYRKWGYLSREVLFNKGSYLASEGMRTHSIKKEARMEILKDLLEKKPRIQVRDYREALAGAISLRQAERDLCSCSFVVSRGKTRGRWYLRSRK